jgi:hypothetical protein
VPDKASFMERRPAALILKSRRKRRPDDREKLRRELGLKAPALPDERSALSSG